MKFFCTSNATIKNKKKIRKKKNFLLKFFNKIVIFPTNADYLEKT